MTGEVTPGGVTLTDDPGLNLCGCASAVNHKQVAIDATITGLNWISKVNTSWELL